MVRRYLGYPIFELFFLVQIRRISSSLRVCRSSRDSRELRHQRGSKIAVENRNPLRKLHDEEHDEEAKRAWESHNNGLHSGRRGIKIPISYQSPSRSPR